MPEWPLYPPVVEHLRLEGYHVATQVTDPRGARVELDVVAFGPDLSDVRIVEVKRDASEALAGQCRDRLRYAARVYAAVPAGRAEAMAELLADDPVGVLAVGDDGVHEVRGAQEDEDRIETGQRNRLHRVLRSLLAEGAVEPPRHG